MQPRTQIDSCSDASRSGCGTSAQRWLDGSPQRGFEHQSPAKSTSSCASGISDGFWPRSLADFDGRRENIASGGTDLNDPWSDLCDDRSKKYSRQEQKGSRADTELVANGSLAEWERKVERLKKEMDEKAQEFQKEKEKLEKEKEYLALKRERSKIPRDHPEQPSARGYPGQPSSHNAYALDSIPISRFDYPDQPSSHNVHSQDAVLISRHRNIVLEPVGMHNGEPTFARMFEEEVVRRRNFHPLGARQLSEPDGESVIPWRTLGEACQETIDLHLRIPESSTVNSPWPSYRIGPQR